MKKSILFISCEEAHHICDKNQYGEATAWERFKLGIRLSWCKITEKGEQALKSLASLKSLEMWRCKEDADSMYDT